MSSSYSIAATIYSCVFPVLAIVAVGFRLKARMVQKTKLGLDDWLILVALALAIAYCCLVLYGSVTGLVGQAWSTVTPEDYSNYQQHLYVGAIVSHLCYGFVKLAVLQFFKSLFSIHSFMLSANITIVLVILFMVSATITQIFAAWPISNFWTLGETYSINYGAFITSFAAIDLILDVIILCLPLPVIRNLQITRGRKIMLIGAFWVGFFCVIATAVRLYYGYRLGTIESDEEFTYVSVNSIIWAEIESCCSVIAACLPTYAPYIRASVLPKIINSRLQSLRNFGRRRSTGRSSKNGQKSPWQPLPEGRRSFTTVANNSEGSEVGLTEIDGVHVKRTFATEAHRTDAEV